MSYRLTKIYTRKGDDGTTSLDARHRMAKDHIRIEAIGTIDELNSALGMVLALPIHTADIQTTFFQTQQDLFNLGGEFCPPHRIAITPEHITRLENKIDEWNATLAPLKEFILPGGNPTSATCHLARAICRRAERCAVTLHTQEPLNPDLLRYLNRLSDLLFVAARRLAQETQSKEISWEHTRN